METSLLHRLTKRETNRHYSYQFVEKSHVDHVLLKQLHLEHELKGHRGCVNCLDWNSSGTLLASGSDDANIIIWNPFVYKQCNVISTGHTGNIFSVKFIPKTRDCFVASGAADSKVYLHDVTRNEIIHGYSCDGRVKRLVCSPDAPHCLWSASEDGIVREFDIRLSAKCTKNLIDLTKSIGKSAECKCLAINPLFSHMLAVGANDPYVRMYDRRMIKEQSSTAVNGQKRKDNIHLSHDSCATYFIPGHLHHKQVEYSRKMRFLCATYVTFNSHGDELLVNVGGEQVYLYDLNNRLESLYRVPRQNPAKRHMNGISDNGETQSTSHFNFSLSNNMKNMAVNETDGLAPDLESLKVKANDLFHKKQYTDAIMLYNKAILKAPKSAVMYGNRAAAYLKRAWDGDVYAALRDCCTALTINPSYAKASFRLAKCLYELHWFKEASHCIKTFKISYPDYAKKAICIDLEKKIKASVRTPDKQSAVPFEPIDELEIQLQSSAIDYNARYCGHCNTTTDIKEANFFGNDGQFVIAGSDDGSFFVWERKTTNLVQVMKADDSIVNCLQPHPSICMLASSGIDPYVRLWSPSGSEASDRTVKETENAAAANQQRMNADPFESMLLSMGMRTSVEGNEEGVIPCRPS